MAPTGFRVRFWLWNLGLAKVICGIVWDLHQGIVWTRTMVASFRSGTGYSAHSKMNCKPAEKKRSNQSKFNASYCPLIDTWYLLARPEEEIAYGLVDQPCFFDLVTHTIFYFGLIREKVGSSALNMLNVFTMSTMSTMSTMHCIHHVHFQLSFHEVTGCADVKKYVFEMVKWLTCMKPTMLQGKLLLLLNG